MNMRRVLSCILLPAYLSSCTAWHVQRAGPAQVIEEEQPSRIRVTTTGHADVILEAPRVSGDTLTGLGPRNVSWAGSVYPVSDTGSMLEIPLADISHVALKKTDATRSVLLVLGIAAGLFAMALVVCGGDRCAPDFSNTQFFD